MATRSSTADQGSFARAFMRNATIFLIGHFLFRGNETLWVVIAAVVGALVGAAGMWFFRHAHHGSLLEAVTRPGGWVRLRSSARARPAPRRARP